MSAPSESAPQETATNESGSVVLFVLVSVGLACFLGVMAGQAPDRIRPFGLFSLGFGLACGWLMTWLATSQNLTMDRRKVAVIAFATLAGLVTYVCRSAALMPVSAPRLPHPVEALVAEQMLKAREAGEIPTESQGGIPLIQPMSLEQSTFLSRIQIYLHRRVSGVWSSPWPELLWTFEAIVGVAGAVWVANRFRPIAVTGSPDPHPAQEPSP